MPCRACNLNSVIDPLISHTLVDPVSHILSDRHQKRYQDSTELTVLLSFGGLSSYLPLEAKKTAMGCQIFPGARAQHCQSHHVIYNPAQGRTWRFSKDVKQENVVCPH